MVYDDGLIACAEDTLTIRKYGLFLRPKRIPYTQVRSLNHTANNRRELDQRSNNGIHVHLLWCPADDSLAVTVLEDAGDSFELIVDAHEALEVFNHPYAYAAFRGCLESADIAA